MDFFKNYTPEPQKKVATWNKIAFGLSVVMLLSIALLQQCDPMFECKGYVESKNQTFNGRILKFISNANGTRMNIHTSQNYLRDYWIDGELLDSLAVGDSVFKKPNEFNFTVIRKDSIFSLTYVSYDEECEKTIERVREQRKMKSKRKE
ncbi:MAG: hypothetical protein V4642_08330 [Bacteroidota bacterium]